MQRLGFGVIVVLVVIAVALALWLGPAARAAVIAPAPRCPLADEAKLDWHPLTPNYIGRLVAQQLMDDGVKNDQVPVGYELEHAAHEVASSCL